MSLKALEQSVLAIEDDYVRAELSRDEVALRQLVDDRFVLNRSNGTTEGKAELITSIFGMRMTGQGGPCYLVVARVPMDRWNDSAARTVELSFEGAPWSSARSLLPTCQRFSTSARERARTR
jgi:hypothetical protein